MVGPILIADVPACIHVPSDFCPIVSPWWNKPRRRLEYWDGRGERRMTLLTPDELRFRVASGDAGVCN